MSLGLIFFIIIQVAALIYFIEMLRRVSKRVNEYQLSDTHNTLPFGFIKLRYIVILYILCYVAWVLLSIVFYITFIDSSSSYYYGHENESTETHTELKLNL